MFRQNWQKKNKKANLILKKKNDQTKFAKENESWENSEKKKCVWTKIVKILKNYVLIKCKNKKNNN